MNEAAFSSEVPRAGRPSLGELEAPWRSLRWQVALAALMLGGALVFAVVRLIAWSSIERNRAMDRAEERTLAAAAELAEEYRSWRWSWTGSAARDGAALADVTERVLRLFPGVEGGFFDAGDTTFYGFAFPTSPPPRPAYGPPPREVDLLQRLSEASRRTGTSHYEWHDGSSTFGVAAAPVPDIVGPGGRAGGAAWTLMRVALPRPISDPWLMAAFALALVGGGFAVRVVLDLRRQAALIRGGIGALSHDLRAGMPLPADPEFAAIARAIDGLAASLAESRRAEAALVADLSRHERMATLGRFAAGVAHEVRTPLAGIKTRLQLWLRRAPEAVQQDPMLPAVIAQIDRLSEMVEHLYGLARIGQMPLERGDLGAAVRAAVHEATPRAAERGASLNAEISDRLPEVRFNQVAVALLVSNLVDNAVQANASRVRLVLAPSDGAVQLAVHDDGPGPPAEGAERWLEPFYSTRPEGLGLGLAICYEVAQHHRGALSIARSPLGGTMFTFAVPIPAGAAQP